MAIQRIQKLYPRQLQILKQTNRLHSAVIFLLFRDKLHGNLDRGTQYHPLGSGMSGGQRLGVPAGFTGTHLYFRDSEAWDVLDGDDADCEGQG